MDFNSILIGSEDPKGLTEYYTKLFGAPVWEGDYTGWQLGSGWITVGPHDQVKGRNANPGRIIWNIETADVRGEFERLKSAGGNCRAGAIRTWGGNADRHLRRPRRQLLPVDEPDDREAPSAGSCLGPTYLGQPVPGVLEEQTEGVARRVEHHPDVVLWLVFRLDGSCLNR